jgi:putative transposase
MPPDTVHYGRSTALTARRGITLDAAFAAHPVRFKGIAPRPPSVPHAVWINPPKKDITPPTITSNCSLNS